MARLFKQFLGIILLTGTLAGCANEDDQPSKERSQEYIEPDWQKFRATPVELYQAEPNADYRPTAGRFFLADLKYEESESLARRLLGAIASRIVLIDRKQHRWQYYESDNDPMHDITLYSQPEPWGSAFGLCRIEKYEISFNDDGSISSVQVSPRYGVEGPIFQKSDFDWEEFRGPMCDDVPPDHTPSYFPAGESVLDAQDLAILLSLAIDEAGRDAPLPYDLSCATYQGENCLSDIRQYLSKLRLQDIDAVSRVNCARSEEDCFTVTVGEHELGPFPKHITIKGTTHMNEWQVYSVSIVESFTMS